MSDSLSRMVWPFRRKTASYNKKEDTKMEYNEIIDARLSAQDARIAALEQMVATLARGGTVTPKRRKRELTPEERVAVRARLLAGQEAARARRDAEAKAEAKREKKESANEG